MNRDRLLDRFLRYVRIDTTACEGAATCPSSPGQLELGRLLVQELRALGIDGASQDEHGIILATLAPTVDRPAPTIALCAHLDTSPETTGAGVKPQVIERYPGGDIVLTGDPQKVIREAEHPDLASLVGRTLVTTDGTTLLGADDKAGVAVIMEAAAWLAEHPEIEHGPVRVLFTCDEEIGHGVDHVDLGRLGATVCYTLDGPGADTIDVETFSADLAVITVRGRNIHPSIAKGRMINAIRVAADLVTQIPFEHLAPETTEGREGFLHPYAITGGVGEATLKVLLRDFQTPRLRELAETLRQAAVASMAQFPKASIEVAVTPQYRNMAHGLAKEPRAVALAEEALRRLGRTATRTIVRGGTDGSRLTELGLPTPNLSTGQHTPHSPLEWACLEEMIGSAEWLVSLARVWGAEESLQ